MTAPDFSYDGFEQLLTQVQGTGYRFRRFDRPQADGKGSGGCRIFLRFDVDVSPRTALRLGTLAHRRGVVLNAFFQLNAETYTLLARHNLDCVRALRAMGHLVGLHIDQGMTGDAEADVAATVAWFSQSVLEIDPVVSFHRPTPAVLGRPYRQVLSAYDARFFAPDRYLSDSRRSLDFWPKLEAWLEEGRSPLQLLLHPVWWHPHRDAGAILEDLRARRRDELDRYLEANFRKVFASLVAPPRTEEGV